MSAGRDELREAMRRATLRSEGMRDARLGSLEPMRREPEYLTAFTEAWAAIEASQGQDTSTDA